MPLNQHHYLKLGLPVNYCTHSTSFWCFICFSSDIFTRNTRRWEKNKKHLNHHSRTANFSILNIYHLILYGSQNILLQANPATFSSKKSQMILQCLATLYWTWKKTSDKLRGKNSRTRVWSCDLQITCLVEQFCFWMLFSGSLWNLVPDW